MDGLARRGFTLIEVIVAILVLAVGLLALAGATAITARRMSENARRFTAASLGRNRAEASLARPCDALGDGSEQWLSVLSEWTISGAAVATDIRQRVTYATRRGDHVDDFLTAAPCG